MFDDNPQYWDAWDVDVYGLSLDGAPACCADRRGWCRFHLEKRFNVGPAESIKVAEEGPLRAVVEVTYQLSPASRLKQRIVLTTLSPRLDFQTQVFRAKQGNSLP